MIPRSRRSPRSLRFNVLRSLVCAWALTTLACGPNEIPAAQLEVSDSAGVRITTITATPKSLTVWTLEPEPRRLLTGAETGDETAFAFIGPVKFLSNGGLVLGDVASGRLILYDAQGKFLRFLGRRGDGPGEMRRLESVTVERGDLLATFDPGLRRLSVWKPDGFLRSVNLADGGSLESWPADAWPWQDSLIVVFQQSITPQDSVPAGSGVRRWPMRAHLTLRDGHGVERQTSPTFDAMYTGLYDRGDTRLPFSNRPFATLAPNRVYFGSGDAFELSWLDTAFRVAGIIRWPAKRERLTSAEVDSVRADAIAILSRRPLPPNPFAMNFAPEILPEFRPSIGRVFVDGEGRLWLERFEAMRMGAVQKPGNQWSILRDDGLPVAVLRLPAQTRLEDVRGDEVVVVRRDSLDVQTVAVHRLRR
jgi:hypothetical protein